jgi:uncharacterized protein with PhoU and TrkA domain
MLAVFSLLVVLLLSLVITRIATVALMHTGLSRESARFQARSAFTGVGFTTSESEGIVNHPVRRRIMMILMLLGNAGIVTVMTSLILTFINVQEARTISFRLFLLVGGLAALLTVANSTWVDRNMATLIAWALKRYTRLEIQDYSSLLHLAGEYRVIELAVAEKDWMAGQTLADGNLREEGVLVLGITRSSGAYIGAPEGTTQIRPGDCVILYGRVPAIERLDQRRRGKRGDRDHAKAVAEQKKIVEKQTEKDPAEDDDEER